MAMTATEIDAITFRQDRDFRGRAILVCNMCDDVVNLDWEDRHIERHRCGEID